MEGNVSSTDILLVSLGSTTGLRASDEAFATLLRGATGKWGTCIYLTLSIYMYIVLLLHTFLCLYL